MLYWREDPPSGGNVAMTSYHDLPTSNTPGFDQTALADSEPNYEAEWPPMLSLADEPIASLATSHEEVLAPSTADT